MFATGTIFEEKKTDNTHQNLTPYGLSLLRTHTRVTTKREKAHTGVYCNIVVISLTLSNEEFSRKINPKWETEQL